MGEPLSVLCRLGGWRDTDIVLRCYQRPDEGDLKAALERRSGPKMGAQDLRA